ncbi:hypothetical protein [Nocardia donostiensis]|uniref:Uncharacterized protein n=1 Tax=Nocardia donostiensis TaxID=1538463 RepID=A0A1V2TAN1_9NOCA|nr:hypothetical protein [Nocardia donostiensis]ONM46560.1 hypothetical protein B0T46_22560 [Nocardia donostiensis]OQS16737.1 hypothetical protein B0T36_03480 [Nocardia donostiensis]OQS23200.1 hypothetical protein B0T44_02795 [Nocardia donostiensis]
MTEPGSATMPDPEVIVIACEAVPRSLRCRIGRPIDDEVLIWGLHRCQRLELNPAADLPTGAATVYFPAREPAHHAWPGAHRQ